MGGSALVNSLRRCTQKGCAALKPAVRKPINTKSLGYVLPNGHIRFQSEEAAVNYAKNRILKHLHGKNPTEYAVIVDGSTVVGEANGDKNSVKISELKYLIERLISDKKLSRKGILYHGHPSLCDGGHNAPPLSCFPGDIPTARAGRLKGIVAFNNRGEYNKAIFTRDISNIEFSQMEKEFEELYSLSMLPPSEASRLRKIIQLNEAGTITKEELVEGMRLFKKVEEHIQRINFTNAHAIHTHKCYEELFDKYGIEYSTNFHNLINQ